MIINFKIFEKTTLENKYIDKFLIGKLDIDKNEPNIRTSIMLCSRIEFKNDINNIFADFDCFDIDFNYNIVNPCGNPDSYTLDEFNKFKFLTPIEFYTEYIDICENLYYKIREDYQNLELPFWVLRIITHYKNVLETIPEFKIYVDSDKFNI